MKIFETKCNFYSWFNRYGDGELFGKFKNLEVEFVGGKVYYYFEVEPEKWEELKTIIEEGGSSGMFVNIYIKPFYETEEIIK